MNFDKQYIITRYLFSLLTLQQYRTWRSKQDGEQQKNFESTSSTNGETSERGATKNERTHEKITLPTFEKRGFQEAKLWWLRFTQYIKMTQNTDLNILTTDREILQ